MNNVITLRPAREPMVWRCNCGCSTHYALEDGTLECASCGTSQIGPTGEWLTRLPEPSPGRSAAPEQRERTVVSIDDPAACLRRTLRKASVGETSFVVVAQNSGAVTTWGCDFKERAQRGWLNRRLADAKRLLTGVGDTE